MHRLPEADPLICSVTLCVVSSHLTVTGMEHERG